MTTQTRLSKRKGITTERYPGNQLGHLFFTKDVRPASSIRHDENVDFTEFILTDDLEQMSQVINSDYNPPDAVDQSLDAALSFRGLGTEIWQGVDPDKYIAELRGNLHQSPPSRLIESHAERLKRAAQLLLGKDAPPLTPEEEALWDAFEQTPDEPLQFNQPEDIVT